MKIRDYAISGDPFDLQKCENCSVVITANPPAEVDIEPYYRGDHYISHTDTKNGLIYKIYHIVRNWMLFRKKQLVSKLGSQKRLLYIGCGTGYFLQYMKKKGYEVRGIEKIDAAKSYAENEFDLTVHYPEVLFKNNILGTFDFVTMWHVLEHLYEPSKYLQAIHNVLNEHGFLILAVPNYTSYDAAYYKSYWDGYDVPRHLWHFSPKSMELLLSKHNFQLKEIHRLPFDAFWVSTLSEKWKGNKWYLVFGFCVGLVSTVISWLNIKRTASLIYVFKKLPIQ
ncbi:MAG: class I SAM-dependent methyltransferase [Bacteroidota bacterium]|nr:class I SAM-dependent methyltransferase [Bacteroidota bacterium]